MAPMANTSSPRRARSTGSSPTCPSSMPPSGMVESSIANVRSGPLSPFLSSLIPLSRAGAGRSRQRRYGGAHFAGRDSGTVAEPGGSNGGALHSGSPLESSLGVDPPVVGARSDRGRHERDHKIDDHRLFRSGASNDAAEAVPSPEGIPHHRTIADPAGQDLAGALRRDPGQGVRDLPLCPRAGREPAS